MRYYQAPENLQIPIASIDARGLPARGSPGFDQALTERYAREYAAKGWSALVTVEGELVRVLAIPEKGSHPKQYALRLLGNRLLDDALPVLEGLYGMLADADVAYSYGVCLSELGRLEESVEALERCLQLNGKHARAHLALGIAYARLDRHGDAERALRQAVRQDPSSSFAKRSLGTVLARCGKGAEALSCFRQAASLAPNEVGAQLGLAQCLDTLGGDHREEADAVYAAIVRRFPDDALAEVAQKARNRIANAQAQSPLGGAVNMDAVFYMRAALDELSGKSREALQRIVTEIVAFRGKGLPPDKPGGRHRLKSLPGEYSALQLSCLLHTSMRMLDPEAEPDTGLHREHELAVSVRGHG